LKKLILVALGTLGILGLLTFNASDNNTHKSADIGDNSQYSTYISGPSDPGTKPGG